MLRYTDIIKAVKDRIKAYDRNARVYSNEVTEGYDRPCYFIGVLPVKKEQQMAYRYKISLLVVISYFSNTDSAEKNYTLLEDLFLKLQGGLKVKNRHLTPIEFTTDSVGDNKREFNLSFSITYMDEITDAIHSENGEIAREVHTKIKEW